MLRNSIKYGFYVLFHPFDGFWDLKHEKKGTVKAALIFLMFWLLTNIFSKLATGFLFNYEYDISLDLFKEFRIIFLFTMLFCIGNWSVTTLMDGKGYFKDIFMLFGYASLPMTLIGIPLTILSQIFTSSESVYYYLLAGFAWVWFGILLFIGIMMIHDYSFLKATGTIILTAAAILVIIFIFMVFYNIFNILISFFLSAYKEISIRV